MSLGSSLLPKNRSSSSDCPEGWRELLGLIKVQRCVYLRVWEEKRHLKNTVMKSEFNMTRLLRLEPQKDINYQKEQMNNKLCSFL